LNIEEDADSIVTHTRRARRDINDPAKVQEHLKSVKRAKERLDEDVERLEKNG